VPPLVPFNLGSLGFLTPFDPARLEQVLLKTFRGKWIVFFNQP
jgi:NAD kinase